MSYVFAPEHEEASTVWLSEREFEALLLASDRKWEFYTERRTKPRPNGQRWGTAIAMSGDTRDHGGVHAHNRVATNLVGHLHAKLRNSGCRVNTSDTAVGLPNEGDYFFPDASVVCGKRELRPFKKIEILGNPTAIFEVTSDSSTSRDRTEKVSRYTSMPSVQLYAILKQDAIEADLLIRTSHNEWAMRNLKGRDASFTVDPPGITLTLGELYEDVELP